MRLAMIALALVAPMLAQAAPPLLTGDIVGVVEGQYSGGVAINLASPGVLPLQLDQYGNLLVDVAIGGGGGGGGVASTVAQGGANTTANAWPVYPVQAGAAVSSTNALYVADVNSAQFTSWPALTANGSGVYTPVAGTRTIADNCTAAGNITLIDAQGDSLTVPASVGFGTLPFTPASFTSTATCTFSSLK